MSDSNVIKAPVNIGRTNNNRKAVRTIEITSMGINLTAWFMILNPIPVIEKLMDDHTDDSPTTIRLTINRSIECDDKAIKSVVKGG